MTREEAIQRLETVKALDMAIEALQDRPQGEWIKIEALQDRPQGEWIKNDAFECSECAFRMIVGDGAYNFCPNCGAMMIGGDDE